MSVEWKSLHFTFCLNYKCTPSKSFHRILWPLYAETLHYEEDQILDGKPLCEEIEFTLVRK